MPYLIETFIPTLSWNFVLHYLCWNRDSQPITYFTDIYFIPPTLTMYNILVMVMKM